MSQPISSSNASSAANTSHDPTLDETGQICRSDASGGSPPEPPPSPPPAVKKLVGAVSPPLVLPSMSAAHNNAQRTSELNGIAPYANAGFTGAGDALYAGAALLKGHDAKSGLDVEVLSASTQLRIPGRHGQEEHQVALVRVGHSSANGSASVEIATARINGGTHNDDGSEGFNFGIGASALAVEATAGSVNSFTYGVAASVGGGASTGLRDLDGDGQQELCVKVSYGPVTVGACVENPL